MSLDDRGHSNSAGCCGGFDCSLLLRGEEKREAGEGVFQLRKLWCQCRLSFWYTSTSALGLDHALGFAFWMFSFTHGAGGAFDRCRYCGVLARICLVFHCRHLGFGGFHFSNEFSMKLWASHFALCVEDLGTRS